MSNANARRVPPAEPREYEPPTGDEPLDLVEQALVRMWVDIIAREIEEDLAALASQKTEASVDQLQPVQSARRRV
jgi:hypothetical protein